MGLCGRFQDHNGRGHVDRLLRYPTDESAPMDGPWFFALMFRFHVFPPIPGSVAIDWVTGPLEPDFVEHPDVCKG